jgi:4,5-DOPA dioxygenase extradiol
MSDPLTRRAALGLTLGAAAWAALGRRAPEEKQTMTPSPKPSRLPVLFVGHGSPMNAIDDNVWSQSFQKLGQALPRPKAILAVSAHWFVAGTFAMSNDPPETIHDFGGFPDALFAMKYPARGDPKLAQRVVDLLGPKRASLSADWGLDHGTWSVLHHTHPKADVPVVQLSIDGRLPAAAHLDLARALAPLRDEGVLIVGSGNVTHNLRQAMTSMRRGDNTTPDWARDFDADVEKALRQHDGGALAKLATTDAGRMAHPSPDHYLPLLYAVGASEGSDTVTFPITGFDAGSLSMRAVQFG